jgi:hypothetical protein
VAGIAGILVDLFSIYKCPTTNITAANTIVNSALANWWTSFIRPHGFKTRVRVKRTSFRPNRFRGRKSGFPSSILRAFAQQHRRHPDEPAPPGERAQHQAGCCVNFSPTSRRSATRWMTVCGEGPRGRDTGGLMELSCKSTPHHSVTLRNGSESGVLLRAGS